MTYKVILLPEAKNELTETTLFYKEVSSELAIDLLNKFYEALSVISENPKAFQKIRKEYRKIVLKRFPFKIIFRISDTEIFVVSFSHQKRKPFYWSNR